ncbi:MAG: hypothetical protein AAF799_47800 [Myxococcota bacterium]
MSPSSCRPVLGLLLAAGLWGCGGPDPANLFERDAVNEVLAGYGLEAEPSESATVELGYQAPTTECAYAYRMTASYEPALRFEEDNVGHLIVGRHPKREADHTITEGPIPPGGLVPAHLFYKGLRAERRGATRNNITFTREYVGPAAPTAACMPRSWDPMEDTLALGWPQLTGRLTAVGEQWNGMRVGGKCSRTACVDPVPGGSGVDPHEMTCVVGPWQERLAGLFEHDGEHYAWIESTWTDGHGPGLGIHTKRRTLVSVEHGRPLWSQTVVDHRYFEPLAAGGFGAIVRTWTLEAIDDCPGSLQAAGWERPPELADTHQELVTELAEAAESRPAKLRRPQNIRPRPELE